MILFDDISCKQLSGSQLKNYRQKKKILSLLYSHETLSATFIGKKIGVSLPTAITLLKELTSKQLVEFRGTGESKGGRKPVLFGLKNNSILVVACELGRFMGKIGVYDSHNQLVAPLKVFETSIDDEQMVGKIIANMEEIIEQHSINVERLFGMGVALPGLVDSKNGINNTIKNKTYRNIKERLEKHFSGLVYINNDARMQAYGEFVFGAAKNYKDAIVLNWNYGLGLGLILNGKLYDGSTGFSGELSHIRFIEDGDLCICGKRGCLETVTSLYVIMAKAKKAINAGKVSQLTNKFKNNINDLKPIDIINAANSGDEFSISILNEVGEAVGKALSNIIQLLNPGVIVLGGTVSRARQHVLAPIQQAINKYCLEQISGKTELVISENWEQSGLLGIKAMLFQKLFSDTYK